MKTENQILYFKIIRRTSKYNKYIKWFLEEYRDPQGNRLVSSCGCRTKKECESKLTPHEMALGDRIIQTIHKPVIQGI